MSKAAEPWRLRGRTLTAMGWLVAAKLAIALIPPERWRGQLGLAGSPAPEALNEARQLAAHVRRGAARLPFSYKCLPQAIALSRMLRHHHIPHGLTIAARPAGTRGGEDDLHAWVALGEQIVLGDLPGPWLPVFSLP